MPWILCALLLFSFSAVAEENAFGELINNIIGNDGKSAEVADPAAAVPANFIQKPYAVLRALDKITARTRTLTVKVGEDFRFGTLQAVVKTCQTRPPEEPPESGAFLQIIEMRAKDGKSEALFSGWMFASSPGLSSLEHPIYDLWLVKCSDNAAAAATKEAAEAPVKKTEEVPVNKKATVSPDKKP